MKYFKMCNAVFGLIIFLGVVNSVSAQKLVAPSLDTLAPISIKTIPPHFYNQSLGFFCEKEWQLQKKTGINLFFRLGTKEYVDYLEQKPNAKRRF